MPEAQVANDDTAFFDNGLRRRSNFSSRFEKMRLDSTASAISMSALLISNSSAVVGTKPDLCGAVLWCHGYQGDVDNQGEWNRRVVEIGVGVSGL